ncbi:MAG: hypothetical protein FWF94_05245 [Oscillospiraceae bacterium]|nr:hypothetical protein [Oscillospiraceae bacterium]
MNELFLFLLIFFSIIGVIKSMNLLYTYVVKRIYYAVRRYKKEESDIKIWMKH